MHARGGGQGQMGGFGVSSVDLERILCVLTRISDTLS
jgi:hypothetical protein